jgi:hypothetical protein
LTHGDETNDVLGVRLLWASRITEVEELLGRHGQRRNGDTVKNAGRRALFEQQLRHRIAFVGRLRFRGPYRTEQHPDCSYDAPVDVKDLDIVAAIVYVDFSVGEPQRAAERGFTLVAETREEGRDFGQVLAEGMYHKVKVAVAPSLTANQGVEPPPSGHPKREMFIAKRSTQP